MLLKQSFSNNTIWNRGFKTQCTNFFSWTSSLPEKTPVPCWTAPTGSCSWGSPMAEPPATPLYSLPMNLTLLKLSPSTGNVSAPGISSCSDPRQLKSSRQVAFPSIKNLFIDHIIFLVFFLILSIYCRICSCRFWIGHWIRRITSLRRL